MTERPRMTRAAVWAMAGLLCAGAAHAVEKPTPPGQPKTGPGGAEYAHAKVTKSKLGKGGTKAWIFEPAEPAPETAPVVILLHGWGVWGPAAYKAWIRHLVRRGSIVIHPKYQSSHVTPPSRMTGNAVEGIKNALAELKKPGHVRPDEKRVAAVGHSLGGVIAANLAATAADVGLPRPRAVMCVAPGDPKHAKFADRLRKIDLEMVSIMADYSKIPKGTLMLVIVADRDRTVKDTTAKLMWRAVAHLPAADRDYITVLSDEHGSPTLKAVHVFPAAPTRFSVIDWTKAGTDALDYYGTWKLLDGLTDAVFHGKHRKYALGNTAEQRYMGKWSDGTPVKPLQVSADE